MDLLDALLRTGALRLAPPGQVFWYTSGTVGPYYINTHYLFGGAEAADRLLAYIDAHSQAPDFHDELGRRVTARLQADADYRGVVAALAGQVRTRPGGLRADWISGGQRRDWFFSVAVAQHLEWPHLYLYKDGQARLAEGTSVRPVDDLEGGRTAHVADLVTEASSYLRTWIPAVRGRGGELALAVNVVDRAQGGLQALHQAGVEATALLRVDAALFDTLRDRGLVGTDQHAVLIDYLRDPAGAMRGWLQAHPGFVEAALTAGDERTAARARLFVARDPYGLKSG